MGVKGEKEPKRSFVCLRVWKRERDANVSLLERREEMSNKESLDGKNAAPLSHLICYILREFFLSWKGDKIGMGFCLSHPIPNVI